MRAMRQPTMSKDADNTDDNERRQELLRDDHECWDRSQERLASEDELRSLAEDIIRYCPSLTHLLLAMGSEENPLKNLN